MGLKTKPARKVNKKPVVKKLRSKSPKLTGANLKLVDSNLLKFPPKVQANIDQVLKTLDVSPLRLQDLQALGYRILKHASEISATLKASVPLKSKKRKGKKA